jgi:hypothetical protein
VVLGAVAVLLPKAAWAPQIVQIDNEATSATNLNAQDLADDLVGTSFLASATSSLAITESVDLSHSSFGQVNGNLTLRASTLNIDGNVQFGTGQFTLQGNTVNLNGKITVSGGALMTGPQLGGTATQVNVTSNGSMAQALAVAAPGATISVVGPAVPALGQLGRAGALLIFLAFALSGLRLRAR